MTLSGALKQQARAQACALDGGHALYPTIPGWSVCADCGEPVQRPDDRFAIQAERAAGSPPQWNDRSLHCRDTDHDGPRTIGHSHAIARQGAIRLRHEAIYLRAKARADRRKDVIGYAVLMARLSDG